MRRIRKIWLRVPPLALAALALGPSAGAAPVRVTGVDDGGYPQLQVTVVSPPGSARPQLRENGLPVTGLQALNLGRAKSVALLVDRSQSMRGGSLADATAAARAFVAAKGAADRIEVIAFGHQAFALTRFSSSTADADAALHGLAPDPQSGTALWDAVTLASHRLASESQPGHVIIVLTDGQDVSSTATFARRPSPLFTAHAPPSTRSGSPAATSRPPAERPRRAYRRHLPPGVFERSARRRSTRRSGASLAHLGAPLPDRGAAGRDSQALRVRSRDRQCSPVGDARRPQRRGRPDAGVAPASASRLDISVRPRCPRGGSRLPDPARLRLRLRRAHRAVGADAPRAPSRPGATNDESSAEAWAARVPAATARSDRADVRERQAVPGAPAPARARRPAAARRGVALHLPRQRHPRRALCRSHVFRAVRDRDLHDGRRRGPGARRQVQGRLANQGVRQPASRPADHDLGLAQGRAIRSATRSRPSSTKARSRPRRSSRACSPRRSSAGRWTRRSPTWPSASARRTSPS